MPTKFAPPTIVLMVVGAMLLVVLVSAVFVFGILGSGSGTPAYLKFTSNDSDYFFELAHACDLLIEEIPAGTNQWIAGNDKRLAPALSKLGAQTIDAGRETFFVNSTDRLSSVQIIMGSGRSGYSIVWSPQSGKDSDAVWVLSANQESLRKVLFSTNKSVARLP